MSKPDTRRSRLTLSRYVRMRNGVPLGAGGSLRNMLLRSLGAPSFSIFWQYWNPIFGYALGKYIYQPLKAVFPDWLCLLVTFVVCGMFHDMFATVFAGKLVYVCSVWFFFMGLGVVVSRILRMDLSQSYWVTRAVANSMYVAACLTIAHNVRWYFEGGA